MKAELQEHIHSSLIDAINNASIDIKLHHIIDINNIPPNQAGKIIEARNKHHKPTWEEIIVLLDQAMNEMNRCTRPFKRY